MLAIQNMATPKDTEVPLADITNASNPTFRNPQTFDAISSQILGLTTIATGLQKEMAQLSRRSKDNATDLVSLKEATNSRDEDIRKSLKELATNIASRIMDPQNDHGSRASNHRGIGTLLLDNKAYTSPSSGLKGAFQRAATPSIFTESELSSSSYSMEGTASIALLEKIWRDMGTKEGQDELVSMLTELKDQPKSKSMDLAMSKKLEEILSAIKEKVKNDDTTSRALVPRRDHGNRGVSATQSMGDDLDLKPAPLVSSSRELTPKREAPKAPNGKATNFISEDLEKLLKKMKDSITEGGGMTAEVKAHVRELRGEVLGMGRDIARRLDQAETSNNGGGDAQGPSREEIAAIVQDGLGELRDQMEALIRERRRQSSSSMSSRRSVDGQEVYAAVKNALVEYPIQQQLTPQNAQPGIEREEILEAVREAWETYKPEIELQNFGLERDEILNCLQEGLQQYQPKEQDRGLGGASYEEILEAVREGLQDFQPPAPLQTEASLTREEILMCVRECLDSYDFPTSSSVEPREPEITRDDVLDAVKEGLSNQAPLTREIEFNREDLFDAVKAGIEGVSTPMGGVGEKVMEKMEELIDDMRVEFKQYSVANGGDTEQVLDAMKDGLEVLRSDIESYVDRAADVTGKDEIIDSMRHGLDSLRADLEGSMASKGQSSNPSDNGVLLDAMEKEFEHLRQTIATSMLHSGGAGPDREEILDTIREGIERPNLSVSRDLNPDVDNNTASHMREEFEHLRETIANNMMRGGGPGDKDEILDAIREIQESVRAEVISRHERPESVLSAAGEVLEAFHEGFDGLRSDVERMMNKPLDMTVNYEILETLKEGLSGIRADVDRLQASQSGQRGIGSMRDGEVVVADENAAGSYRGDITNLEMMITQLRIKVEALDSMPHGTEFGEGSASRAHLENLETVIGDVRNSVAEMAQKERGHNEGFAMKEDIEALETLLRNTKAKVDDLASSDAEGLAKVSHIESLEVTIGEARDALHDLGLDGASRKDFGVLEALLKEVRAGLEDVREKGLDGGERVTKTDIEALETLCMDTKTQIEELPLPDPDSLATKTELTMLEELIRGYNDQVTEGHALSAQAFEARKTEHRGIADKIEDVKLIFEDVREELKARIDENHNTVRDIAETLESVADSIAAADVSTTVEDLRQNVKKEFEAIRHASDNAKEYHEQNHNLLLDKHVEHKTTIINDLNAKLDARFDEIMTKYDDAQMAAQEKEQAFSTRDSEQVAAMNSTKNIVDDLRLLVDTLGSTLTESCDRMTQDSKTVFSRVEEANAKLNDLLTADGRAEHQATRAEISKALAGVEGIQIQTAEYSPKILDAIHDVLGIVGQHYEQTKMSTEEIKTSVQAIPGAIPLPAIAPSAPQPDLLREAPLVEKYDDTHVHTKLDQLISCATETGKSVSELTVLEQIREQVAATSIRLDDFVAEHKAIITDHEIVKQKEAEEAAIALEKRTAQRSVVEMDVVRLSGDRDGLKEEISILLREKDELLGLRSKAQADLSSLETALQIRREELHIMEARADGLERRILDGILDHSRSLLTTSRPQSSLKEMNLKRVTSTSSNTTTTTRKTSAATAVPSTGTSAVSTGVGMALKRRQPPRGSTADSAIPKNDRRILSLSTLGGNKGATTDRSMVLANPSGNTRSNTVSGGPLKRSHSVKSNFPSRKSSWGGTKAIGMYGDDAVDESEDKENSILDEVDEEAEGSEAGTERRTSFTGTDRRTSYSGTYTGTGSYGDGSILSSAADDKRDSYAASTVGTIGTRDFALTEDGRSDVGLDDAPNENGENGLLNGKEGASFISDDAYQHSDLLPRQGEKGEVMNSGEVVLYGPQSDSGIGTDIPTAQLPSQNGSDYFRQD